MGSVLIRVPWLCLVFPGMPVGCEPVSALPTSGLLVRDGGSHSLSGHGRWGGGVRQCGKGRLLLSSRGKEPLSRGRTQAGHSFSVRTQLSLLGKASQGWASWATGGGPPEDLQLLPGVHGQMVVLPGRGQPFQFPL